MKIENIKNCEESITVQPAACPWTAPAPRPGHGTRRVSTLGLPATTAPPGDCVSHGEIDGTRSAHLVEFEPDT